MEQATVSLLKLRGRGVLVDGNIILTAAHCINFETTGGMVLGDYYIEDIKTAKGVKFKVRPIAVEPVADIAALGSVDDQVLPEEADAFEGFCETTKPVRLCVCDFKVFKSFPVFVLNANGKWVRGYAQKCKDDANSFWFETEEGLKGGASGGPIVNSSGELVGIVSHFSGTKVMKEGLTPRPHLTLPVWVCQRIRDSKPRPVVRKWTKSLVTGGKAPEIDHNLSSKQKD